MKSVASLIVLSAALVAGSQPAPATDRVPVVVELFTSEGCSSCPPADVVLSKLAKEAPAAGVEVIPLGMHVTYWDELGWKDPASLTLATVRQHDYGRVFGEDRIYTPQAVVDGREELVGSDEGGVRRAIAKAARQPHAHVTLKTSVDGESLTAEASVAGIPPDVKEPMASRLIVTEDGLTSIVKRGENGGRTLQHDAVARVVLGANVSPSIVFHASLKPEWRRDHLHAVVLLQGRNSQRIWGAATAPLK
jgi:hypothetical protein